MITRAGLLIGRRKKVKESKSRQDKFKMADFAGFRDKFCPKIMYPVINRVSVILQNDPAVELLTSQESIVTVSVHFIFFVL